MPRANDKGIAYFHRREFFTCLARQQMLPKLASPDRTAQQQKNWYKDTLSHSVLHKSF
jgi:hypothetical protein